MRDYELIFIVHPELDETAFTEVVNRIKGWITESGGEITKVDIWGKRRLAYPIRKQIEGQYVLIETKLAPNSGTLLERNIRYLEPVIRYSLIAK
jgi:small subunit ribosomal protein S6